MKCAAYQITTFGWTKSRWSKHQTQKTLSEPLEFDEKLFKTKCHLAVYSRIYQFVDYSAAIQLCSPFVVVHIHFWSFGHSFKIKPNMFIRYFRSLKIRSLYARRHLHNLFSIWKTNILLMYTTINNYYWTRKKKTSNNDGDEQCWQNMLISYNLLPAEIDVERARECSKFTSFSSKRLMSFLFRVRAHARTQRIVFLFHCVCDWIESSEWTTGRAVWLENNITFFLLLRWPCVISVNFSMMWTENMTCIHCDYCSPSIGADHIDFSLIGSNVHSASELKFFSLILLPILNQSNKV